MDSAGGPPVLVVDDAPQNRKLLRAILHADGYAVLEAEDGTRALERMRRERPAAMILDIRMPGLSGYEVCEAVRRDPRFARLPVIMVTALSMPEERIRGIEAGATDFITKPFNKKELLARLRASLAQGCGDLAWSPSPLLLLDPEWRVLALTGSAQERFPGMALEGRDLRPVVADGLSLPEEGSFAGAVHRGRVTAIRDAGGAVVARAVVFDTEILA